MTTLVQQNQQIFRDLVTAMSYPGRLVSVTPTDKYQGNLLASTMSTLFALLDGEVTYQIIGEDDAANQEIQFRTLSSVADTSSADFIIVPLKKTNQIPEIIKKAKKGNLLDPNQSATIIVECDELNNKKSLTWTGPGIKTSTQVNISNSSEWVQAREVATADFPLGIDMILINRDGQLIGLPRTTKVEGVK